MDRALTNRCESRCARRLPAAARRSYEQVVATDKCLRSESPPLHERVLSRDSPTWCSAQNVCDGSRLRARPGAPGARFLRAGVEVGRAVPRHHRSLRSGSVTMDPNVAETRSALPSRVVPVLDGRGRLERAPCCGVSEACGAGKSAGRFVAASPVSVIRVDLKSTPAIIPPDICRRSASLTRRVSERSESMSRDDFPDRGSRPRTASAGAARARQRGTVHRGYRPELRVGP